MRCMHGSVWLAVAVWMAAGSGSLAQTAATTTGTLPTLQAQLLKTIDASRTKAGDELQAKTYTPFEFGSAKVPVGSIVIGHVTEAAPGKLVLVFDRIAINKSPPVAAGLSLRAVMMQTGAQSTGDQISPRAMGGGRSTGIDPNPATPARGSDMLRSAQAAAEDSATTVFRGPERVETRNGGVIGIPGLHLSVTPDPKVGAVFESEKNHKLKLEKGLLLMFVVSEPAHTP